MGCSSASAQAGSRSPQGVATATSTRSASCPALPLRCATRRLNIQPAVFAAVCAKLLRYKVCKMSGTWQDHCVCRLERGQQWGGGEGSPRAAATVMQHLAALHHAFVVLKLDAAGRCHPSSPACSNSLARRRLPCPAGKAELAALTCGEARSGLASPALTGRKVRGGCGCRPGTAR